MTHPDPETLVGLGLGEEDDATLAAHVEGCETCRSEVARTRDVVMVMTGLGGARVGLERPPEHVWAGIREAVFSSDHEMETTDADPSAPTVARHPRWRAAAAAAVGLAVGVAATLAVVLARDADNPARAPETVAEGAMSAVSPGSATTGSAQVLRLGDSRRLRVTLADLPRQDGTYVQTWLFDPATNDMIAIGVMSRDTETFAIPTSVDLSVYTSVDISLEPFDGNPAHSDTSLARGTLTAS